MVTHIVFFKFKDENKQTNMVEAKRLIEDMVGKVPTLKKIEVGINFADEDRAMDMALIGRFDDKAGLEEYATHPVHLKVIEFIKSVAEFTKVVDYESSI